MCEGSPGGDREELSCQPGALSNPGHHVFVALLRTTPTAPSAFFACFYLLTSTLDQLLLLREAFNLGELTLGGVKAIAEFDAESRFRAMAARGSIEKGLSVLDKLDQALAE